MSSLRSEAAVVKEGWFEAMYSEVTVRTKRRWVSGNVYSEVELKSIRVKVGVWDLKGAIISIIMR